MRTGTRSVGIWLIGYDLRRAGISPEGITGVTAPRGDQIIDGYLAQLQIALGDLPIARRAQIMGEVRDRITQARTSMADESDADIFRLLEQIGDPAVVAAQGLASLPAPPRTGWLEVVALAGLLLIWPVGVVLLWFSRVWSRRDKLIGTLVPPGGVAFAIAVLVLSSSVQWTCDGGTYDANGHLIAPGNCPPEPMLTLGAVLLTMLFNGTVAFWPILAISSALYLAWRAWGSTRQPRPAPTATPTGPSRGPRLALILAVVAGPLVGLLLVSAGVLVILASEQSQRTDRGESAGPPPSDFTSGPPAFPALTPSQFTRAFGDKGFSCDEPHNAAGQWVTSCITSSGFVVAFGSDAHTIYVITATPSGGSQGPEQAGQFFDTVVQGVCRPADWGQINAWVHGHMEGGGQTDIDGYNVTTVGLPGTVALTIVRSRP